MTLIYKYISSINLISYLVVFSLIFGLVFLKKKKQSSKILLLVLLTSSITEITAFGLITNHKNLNLLYSFFYIIHNGLWLILLGKILNNRIINSVTILFFVFGFLNLFFIEGSNLNYMTFVVGSLLYISVFAIESYRQLKSENLNFFVTTNYLLLFTPILFFFGLSFLLSFRNLDIMYYLVFDEIYLYNCIIYFVNITYYSLITLYIYREYQLKND